MQEASTHEHENTPEAGQDGLEMVAVSCAGRSVGDGFVQLQTSGPSDADCPFSGQTEIPWVVNPLVQQPTSTRNVNIWVSGYLKDSNDWIWLQAYSYTVSGGYYAASSVGNPSNGNFDISLGTVSTPSNGTIKVMGFFQTPTTAYTTPQSYWATVAWNYDAT